MTPNEFMLKNREVEALERIAKALENLNDKTSYTDRGECGPG